ncbi:arsenic resistance N-acetyltransferase ArsN2 [Mesorhizobium sp. M1B.F.Ca.ET.045.04.1.1]|uniref:arsenic resistance N-acetyltransferase ArsN2 n=1 Tax=Mesorhizobium sp. M1B.F.Ca.ET.045.04.1.1 TaxID=2493673 RepID=UPI000F75F205|nr:arsenic resistance N-acetyltransferase ArsN2 [Mesorhizobium sp. M1B.F.Ca.ET.045.04.1.1]AZO32296.1 GNAT family N-acetyltransferase [Mesorhizobium sp. M1B.F.Ca.ET.045.04.1.1]
MIVEAIEANNPELRLALGGAATPVDDLDDAHRTFFRFVDEGQTIGFAGLETYGPNALLRSLVILPEARSIGLGRRATGLLLEQARAAGAAHAYLLTIDAVPFFADMGFEVVVRLDAPAEILATRQAESLCSSTAVLMARPI